MSRARTFDLAYEHSTRAVPPQQAPPSRPFAQGRDLHARLRCLKALMDAERNGFGLLAATRALHS